MHLNILQSLQLLKFESVGAIDLPIGGGITLSTREELVDQATEGKMKKVRMPTGTGSHYGAHLYAFNRALPIGDEEGFAKRLMVNFGSASQLFLEALWLVKDNSGSAGALYGAVIGPAPKQINIPHSAIHSDSACQKVETVFLHDDLTAAIAHFHQLLRLMPTEEPGSEMALGHPSRIGRALYLTQGARTTSEVGIKTAMYCMAFECLLSTRDDLAGRIVKERGSRFLEPDGPSRLDVRRSLKWLYRYRSIVVHGGAISAKHGERIRRTTQEVDGHLRRTFQKILADQDLTDLFSTNDRPRINAYFNDEFLNCEARSASDPGDGCG